MVSEIFNVECNAVVDMTLIRPLNKGQDSTSFILVPIDFSYTTSYGLSIPVVLLCLLAYKAVHGLAPHYLADMCRPVSSVDARRRLRSAAREDLDIPRTATKFGARSFAVAAPSEWNRLPLHIRSKPSVNCFKVALKSFLFTTDSS